ncbi:MAG: hypothetical protein SFY32_04195 [Bacteroidota bacterium]|nr:hypothetical protein [Bacteroidota bacterium]
MDKADLRELLKAEIELFKALSFYVGGLATGLYIILKNEIVFHKVNITDILFYTNGVLFILFSVFLGISLFNIYKIKGKL